MKHAVRLIISVFTLCAFVFVSSNSKVSAKQNPFSSDEAKYMYKIAPVSVPVSINAQWDKKLWMETKARELVNYMGEKPAHFPNTQVKVRYDNKNIYVIFQVKDQYVKAVAKKINEQVCTDSCVEFFFTPGPDVSRGYFNLETNCMGIFLFRYSNNTDNKTGLVGPDDCKMITMAHSLQKDVTTEIQDPTTWSVEYAVPYALLEKYMKVDKPGKGVQWRANFYKCADKTSHPHWLTWAPVVNPVPKFHLPEYFGWLQFE
jgi:hypothetical protein